MDAVTMHRWLPSIWKCLLYSASDWHKWPLNLSDGQMKVDQVLKTWHQKGSLRFFSYLKIKQKKISSEYVFNFCEFMLFTIILLRKFS